MFKICNIHNRTRNYPSPLPTKIIKMGGGLKFEYYIYYSNNVNKGWSKNLFTLEGAESEFDSLSGHANHPWEVRQTAAVAMLDHKNCLRMKEEGLEYPL